MKSLELFLATTPLHFTVIPTIVITRAEGSWVVAFEWMGVAAGIESR